MKTVEMPKNDLRLHRVISSKDTKLVKKVEIIKSLLSNDKKLFFINDDMGLTPLHVAMNQEPIDIGIIKLLANKNTINLPDPYTGTTALHKAIINYKISPAKNTSLVELLVKKGADLTLADNSGITALALSMDIDYRITEIMLEKAKVNGENNLHVALRLADKQPDKDIERYKLVERLIKNHPEYLTMSDKSGKTPLEIIVNSKNIELQKLFLDNINKENLNKGFPILHLATLNNDTKFIELLKKKDSELIRILDTNGLTPIELAMGRSVSHETLETLLKHDEGNPKDPVKESIYPSKDESNVRNSLQYSVRNPTNIDIKKVESLLKAASRRAITSLDSNGSSPLSSVIDSDNPELVKVFLNSGKINFDHEDEFLLNNNRVSVNPLEYAIMTSKISTFHLFLNEVAKNKDVNIVNNALSKALIRAIEKNDFDIIRPMISIEDFQLDLSLDDWKKSIDLALSTSTLESDVGLLINKIEKIIDSEKRKELLDDTLYKLVRKKDLINIKKIVENPDINLSNDKLADYFTILLQKDDTTGINKRKEIINYLIDRTPIETLNEIKIGKLSLFQKAIVENYDDVISKLIDKKIDINKGNNNLALNRLIAENKPIAEGEIDIIDKLLTAGIRVNGRDEYGKLPIHHAAEQGNSELVKRLIRLDFKKETLDVKDNAGNTPLHYAVANPYPSKLDFSSGPPVMPTDRESIAKTLIADGADHDITNNDNKRPIDLAKDNGLESIEKLLKEQDSWWNKLKRWCKEKFNFFKRDKNKSFVDKPISTTDTGSRLRKTKSETDLFSLRIHEQKNPITNEIAAEAKKLSRPISSGINSDGDTPSDISKKSRSLKVE